MHWDVVYMGDWLDALGCSVYGTLVRCIGMSCIWDTG